MTSDGMHRRAGALSDLGTSASSSKWGSAVFSNDIMIRFMAQLFAHSACGPPRSKMSLPIFFTSFSLPKLSSYKDFMSSWFHSPYSANSAISLPRIAQHSSCVGKDTLEQKRRRHACSIFIRVHRAATACAFRADAISFGADAAANRNKCCECYVSTICDLFYGLDQNAAKKNIVRKQPSPQNYARTRTQASVHI